LGLLRDFALRRGIQAVCGRPDFVSTGILADASLLGVGARYAALRLMGLAGMRSVVTRSGLGFDFVCHIGDLAEFPFCIRRAYARELAICEGWLAGEEAPVVFDFGANVGFVSTHLAQMLAAQAPRIYAFEPVAPTFDKLVDSVRRLGLNECIVPCPAAVAERSGEVRMAASAGKSMLARVTGNGEGLVAAAVSLDDFCASAGVQPALIKMDIEGSEAAALRGGRRCLEKADRPAILFEYDPGSLARCGESGKTLADGLVGYDLYYVDDLRGQLRPLGSPVAGFEDIDWICNLFAVPEGADLRWTTALARAERRLQKSARRSARSWLRHLPAARTRDESSVT
jgi:FkbM family methyltransferase